jgi:hypothetical protein
MDAVWTWERKVKGEWEKSMTLFREEERRRENEWSPG